MLEPVVSRASISVSLPAGSQVLFISDVHLGYGAREQDIERENRLLEVLQGAMQTCAHLFIVGDLFDLWFDYKRAIPRGHVRTLACLRAYRDAGIPVTYLMGNHDFGHYTYFRDELDIEVLGGDVIADIDGKKFRIRAFCDDQIVDIGSVEVIDQVVNETWIKTMTNPENCADCNDAQIGTESNETRCKYHA